VPLNTVALELVPPNTDRSPDEILDEARKVVRFSAETGLDGHIGHVMIPGMIAEDDDRPVEMKPKLDVLDYWSRISPELPGVKGLCTQVTAFMDEAMLRGRLTELLAAGMEGIVFVGVPRTMSDGEGSGVAPTDALSIYRDLVPNRGAILIPTRDGEAGRFGFKIRQGATYGMTQLLYSDAIVGFLTDFARDNDDRPEILLSFGFRAQGGEPDRPHQLADPGSGQRQGRRRTSGGAGTGRRRTRGQAPDAGRPVQAGRRRGGRAGLPAEHSFRGHVRDVASGVRHICGDAGPLVARRHRRVVAFPACRP